MVKNLSLVEYSEFSLIFALTASNHVHFECWIWGCVDVFLVFLDTLGSFNIFES